MIINKRNGRVVCTEEEFAVSSTSKALGLMFRKPRCLVFVFKKEVLIPIHMLFVFFPLDLIYLDSKWRVVELNESLKPFTFYNPRRRARYLVEARRGAIKAAGIKTGDTIEVKE